MRAPGHQALGVIGSHSTPSSVSMSRCDKASRFRRSHLGVRVWQRAPKWKTAMPDPLSLTARDAAREIAAGRLRAETLVSAVLERIAEREPVGGAWHYLDRDAVL